MKITLFSFLAGVIITTTTATTANVVTLDGTALAHVYDGHGGLSAGASSRLLFDYPDVQRNEVLDYLFKPSFGMNLAQFKMEASKDGKVVLCVCLY